jgi:large subunit ribosomal protein L15
MSEKQQLKLHHLVPAPGSKKSKIRVGRGEGGRRGKTAGRGTKGLKARNSLRPGFEGGQMPLVRQLPKLGGFTNVNKEYFAIINVGTLAAAYPANSSVTIEDLKAKGLVKHKGRVKVLGEGELAHALTVQTHAISGAAREKIESAGGTVELVTE